jgi:hypothetical protein
MQEISHVHPVPATDNATTATMGTSRIRGRVRVVLTDGRVLYGTPIREWDPVLTDEDYSALARCRDELRAVAARRRTSTAEPASAEHDIGLPRAA